MYGYIRTRHVLPWFRLSRTSLVPESYQLRTRFEKIRGEYDFARELVRQCELDGKNVVFIEGLLLDTDLYSCLVGDSRQIMNLRGIYRVRAILSSLLYIIYVYSRGAYTYIGVV